MKTENSTNLKKELEMTNTDADREFNIAFKDFHSFMQLQNQRDILYSLVECYQNIFSEPEVWNEFYSVGEIIDKLKQELTGHCALRVCLDQDTDRVVGFCWAQSLGKAGIFNRIQSVKYLEDTALTDIESQLETLLGNEPAVYLQDLGVDKAYRQSIPLKALILPPIKSTALQSSNEKLLFWSVAETCIAHLSSKVGIKPFYRQDNMLFFCGELV